MCTNEQDCLFDNQNIDELIEQRFEDPEGESPIRRRADCASPQEVMCLRSRLERHGIDVVMPKNLTSCVVEIEIFG